MPPEEDRATATGDAYKKFGEDHVVPEIDRQTHTQRQSDKH